MENQLEDSGKLKTTDIGNTFKLLSKKDLKALTPTELKKYESTVMDKYSELVQVNAKPTNYDRPLNAKQTKLLERIDKYIENFKGQPKTVIQDYKPLEKKEKESAVKIEKPQVEQKPEPSNDQEKNVDYIKNQIKYLGFGESPEIEKDLVRNIEKGDNNFSMIIDYGKASKGNKASFELLFNRSEQSGRYFLNNFVANLMKEKNNEVLSHRFPINTTGFSAKQAINLLEGRNVLGTVHNDRTKSPERAFISFKLNEPKNDYGNFKWNVFDKSKTIQTSTIVEAASLKFESDKHKEVTIKSLERGNVVSVKFPLNGKDIEGKAVLNASNNNLKLYTNDMERVNDNKPLIAEKLDIESTNKNTMKQSR